MTVTCITNRKVNCTAGFQRDCVECDWYSAVGIWPGNGQPSDCTLKQSLGLLPQEVTDLVSHQILTSCQRKRSHDKQTQYTFNTFFMSYTELKSDIQAQSQHKYNTGNPTTGEEGSFFLHIHLSPNREGRWGTAGLWCMEGDNGHVRDYIIIIIMEVCIAR